MMNAEIRTLDGKKVLVLAGRTIQSKADVAKRIAMLDEHITKKLPAAKAALDGATLVAQAQAAIDRKVERLTAVRDALAEIAPELDD